MAMREKTREDDERELRMLEGRCLGVETPVLSRQYGMRATSIRTLTNRIRDAHAEHSGEDVSGWW